MQTQPEITDHESVRKELADFAKIHALGTPDKPDGTLAIKREVGLFDRAKAIKEAHAAVVAELIETRDRSIEALLEYGVHTTVDTETKKLGRPIGAKNRKPKEAPAQ